jgi:D-psicose/D-tagatose/L-ribulose 3-epimerase
MRFGICTSVEFLTDAYNAGFDYAELSVGALIPTQNDAAFKLALQGVLSSKIRVEAFNCFVSADHRLTGPNVDLVSVAAWMDLVLKRASQAGAKIMVFGSGGARRAPEGFPLDKAREQFRQAAQLAAQTAQRYGMTVALEPLCSRQCNFFNRVDQGIDLVDKVGHPSLGLLADLFHMTEEKEPLQSIVAAGKRLAHMHLATPSLAETGQGYMYDFRGFLEALREAGYNGRCSVEDNAGLLRDKKPPLIEVYKAIREFLGSTFA